MKIKNVFLFVIFILSIGFINAQNYEWAKGIGGVFGEEGRAIAIDTSENIYITGFFESKSDFNPGADTAFLTPVGLDDIFIAKYDKNGNYIWAKQIGGVSHEAGYSVIVDDSGNVYVTGRFQGTVDFDTGSDTVFLVGVGATADAFLAKYDYTGNYVWAVQIGGNSSDAGTCLHFDNFGNICITGYFSSTVDFDQGAGTANLTSAGSSDIFIAKYDINGNYIWANKMGGSGADNGQSIEVDTAGNIYATGLFQGTADFDPGAGTNNLVSYGSIDMYIAKYSPGGTYLWAYNIGGNSTDIGYSLKIGTDGNLYITGSFQGTVDFDSGSGTQNITSTGMNDIFVAKYNNNGNYIWAFKLGGTSIDNGNYIEIDAFNNIYVTGFFRQTIDFDPGSGIANLSATGLTGSQDIFLAKYNSSGNYLWAVNMGGNIEDIGYALCLDNSNNIYLTGLFYSTADFDPSLDTATLTSHGIDDIFIAKYVCNYSASIADSVCHGANYIFGSQILNTAGIYTETFPSENGCDSIITLNLSVIPVDTSVTQSSNTLTANATGVSYQWFDCSDNTIIQGEISQSYTALSSGSYAVIITYNNGCSDTSSCFIISVVGIQDVNINGQICLFPNPANDKQIINLGKVYKHVLISIFDIDNKEVFKKEYSNQQYIEISTKTLVQGVYFLRITDNEKTLTLKVVKE